MYFDFPTKKIKCSAMSCRNPVSFISIFTALQPSYKTNFPM